MPKKIAIITGASRGVGKEVALDLSKQHYHTILIAKTKTDLSLVEQEICELGLSTTSYVQDITNYNDTNACIDDVIKKYGSIDLLFNNAGIFYEGTSMLNHNNLLEMIHTNLLGVINLANSVSKYMKRQKSGYIINVASLAGTTEGVNSYIGGYGASKFGVVGYSHALHEELLPYGIKVIVICPGPINTTMINNNHIKREYLIQPTEIVKIVNFITGLDTHSIIKEIRINCLMLNKPCQKDNK